MLGDDLMSGPSIRFEPLEKEWFITAARGNRAQIMCLLEQDRNLATKRGYTPLHLAAMHGHDDVIKTLVTDPVGALPNTFRRGHGHSKERQRFSQEWVPPIEFARQEGEQVTNRSRSQGPTHS
ncbi:hypothetical protein P5673_017876 [Acropora cervicornis]|uniref:Uncharacterized protein n=1 Tax=Acropora cervicornis TaxID=6130 RepID=A0AAD9QF78_ACRCE|nr:hypothetical protein P5673_017876 [Acropora cervicornis]